MSILDQKPKSALKEGFGTKFGIGLIVALSLSLAAFQIKAPYQEHKIVFADPFSEDGVIVDVDPIMSHSREKNVEPVKPKPAAQVVIVIGDPMPSTEPGPAPIDIMDNPFAGVAPPEDINEKPAPPKPEPVRVAEVMPEYPGGVDALLAYLAGTPYCDAAIDNGYEGKVLVEFMVDTDGSIKNVKVVGKKLFSCLDQAVVNRVKNMEKWTPGYMGKQAVPVIMVAPVNFSLN